jgi:hypothetical protein
MKRNVGTLDRLVRVLAAVGLLGCAVGTPLPIATRLAAFALPGVYMLFSALAGTCFGYAVLGKSTCAAPRR